MTNMLGSRVKTFAATTCVLAALGCTSSPTPDGRNTPPDIRLEKVDDSAAANPAKTTTDTPQESRPTQTYERTARAKAQKIYIKGLELFEQHEFDLAYLEFTRALDVDPTYHLAWFKKGL